MQKWSAIFCSRKLRGKHMSATVYMNNKYIEKNTTSNRWQSLFISWIHTKLITNAILECIYRIFKMPRKMILHSLQTIVFVFNKTQRNHIITLTKSWNGETRTVKMKENKNAWPMMKNVGVGIPLLFIFFPVHPPHLCMLNTLNYSVDKWLIKWQLRII